VKWECLHESAASSNICAIIRTVLPISRRSDAAVSVPFFGVDRNAAYRIDTSGQISIAATAVDPKSIARQSR